MNSISNDNTRAGSRNVKKSKRRFLHQRTQKAQSKAAYAAIMPTKLKGAEREEKDNCEKKDKTDHCKEPTNWIAGCKMP